MDSGSAVYGLSCLWTLGRLFMDPMDLVAHWALDAVLGLCWFKPIIKCTCSSEGRAAASI